MGTEMLLVSVEVGKDAMLKSHEPVEALTPIPMPIRRRFTNCCCQFWLKAEPITGQIQKWAEKKMTPISMLRGEQLAAHG